MGFTGATRWKLEPRRAHGGRRGELQRKHGPYQRLPRAQRQGGEIPWLLPSPALLSPPVPPIGHLRGLGRAGVTRHGSEGVCTGLGTHSTRCPAQSVNGRDFYSFPSYY